jgi:hypothetical protein
LTIAKSDKIIGVYQFQPPSSFSLFWSPLMNAKIFGLATLLCAFVSTAYSAPTITISPGGVQAGNWVWNVSITPDLSLVPDNSGTPVAAEFGFRLTADPLVNVSNINPSEWDTSNPGKVIFGWETLYADSNNHPEGIEANCAACTITNTAGGGHSATIVNGTANEIFASLGSINFTTPGAKPLLKITALGPGNGGPLSSTIDWLGAYNSGKGIIAQIDGGGFGNSYTVGSYFFSGSATQAVPEPASAALIATIACGFFLQRPRRCVGRAGKH